jgi:ATP-dependent Clp protease ATP-binding subunit ClpA
VLAQQEARELNSDDIRPEHLLVGVLQSAGRELSSLLADYGLTGDAVRGRLEPGVDTSFESDADALRSIGIDLHAVRDDVARKFGPDAWDDALHKSGRRRRRRGHHPFAKSTKKVLELALREALAHKDSTLRCEHLLLGILRGEDAVAVGLITEHVDVATLRTALLRLLDRAA